jgi:oxepin-CoA hydrolase/3-oxo-5,6-dehydrosuberyl-CoA semialdehyde dehydrogenase
VPRGGVAVHINAFNFPVWGLLEKFAPSFLAGMPCIAKPATATSYLTEAMVRLLLSSGLLPAGALQLVIGSTGDLLDRLNGQDVVTFTGSPTPRPSCACTRTWCATASRSTPRPIR